jgi:hypothetical protein
LSPASEIDQATINAYRETDYLVAGPAPFVMRVGRPCMGLVNLFKQYDVDRAAFISACNPHSERLDALDNCERQSRLSAELSKRGFQFIDGVGKHPVGDWPSEPSYLVLSLTLADAKAIGTKYDQNAIVWCGADAVPNLVLLR